MRRSTSARRGDFWLPAPYPGSHRRPFTRPSNAGAGSTRTPMGRPAARWRTDPLSAFRVIGHPWTTIDDLPAGAFTSDELAGMANAFAAVMDTVAARAKTTDDFGGNVVWTKALNLLKRTQPEAFQQMVEAGSSVNWFADVIRDQGLAHGLPDAARMDRERQWLSRQQFDDAIRAFVVRVEGISPIEVFAMPEPLAVLFCWAQLGPEPKLRAYLEAGTIEDESFIAAMEAMRGWLSSSDKGVSHPLYREYVAAFMDADAAKNRLSQIANNVSSELSSQAKDLVASWRDQRR